MELVVESDIYEPSIGDDGNYSDYLPPSSKFQHGLRCPCGARKDHVFDSRHCFSIHIKSKTHGKWLSELNMNKMNYYTECEKLKDIVSSQKQIIARLEKEINVKLKTIDYLTKQLMHQEQEEPKKQQDALDLPLFD
jgi:hypothetical protein